MEGQTRCGASAANRPLQTWAAGSTKASFQALPPPSVGSGRASGQMQATSAHISFPHTAQVCIGQPVTRHTAPSVNPLCFLCFLKTRKLNCQTLEISVTGPPCWPGLGPAPSCPQPDTLTFLGWRPQATGGRRGPRQKFLHLEEWGARPGRGRAARRQASALCTQKAAAPQALLRLRQARGLVQAWGPGAAAPHPATARRVAPGTSKLHREQTLHGASWGF